MGLTSVSPTRADQPSRFVAHEESRQERLKEGRGRKVRASQQRKPKKIVLKGRYYARGRHIGTSAHVCVRKRGFFFPEQEKGGEKGKELEIKRGNLGVFEAVVLKKLKAPF